jgi:DNA-binding transcriptional regulator LsrR (DeoR family)
MVDARRRSESVSGELMLEIARAYYLQDRSKVQIAEDKGLSRWQVARILDEARARGIVTIHVGDPGVAEAELGLRLAEALSIRYAVVVGRSRGLRLAPTPDTVSQALAEHLAAVVQAGQHLGLGWSRIIEALPAHLNSLAPCDVVQLAGALTFAGDRVGSVEVIRQVARIAGGTAYPIYAPLVAPSGSIAASLNASSEIADVLARVATLDHAVVGIGTWTQEGSSILPLLPEKLVARTAEAGAAAVISGRVVDASGKLLDVGVDERIVGVSLDQLRQIPNVIGTCLGAHRAAAVAAAVRGGFVNTLIVDEPLARALLES